MYRCLQLAGNNRDTASPNPVVGCVIVHNDVIIGEGYTSAYGGPHAEVNAIESVEDKSLLAASTIYVSLEPCSHYGKTPPCAELIVKHRIPQVVVGIQDPNELVAGKGIRLLEEAGCQVTSGVLKQKCYEANRKFFVYHQKKRPYIILKWAESADGFLAPDTKARGENPEPYWITNPYSRQLVHLWRTQEQAVLVGTQTVLDDNPRLNTRQWQGRSPVRVVLDRDLRIPSSYRIFDQSSATIIFTEKTENLALKNGIQYEKLDFSGNTVAQMLDILWQKNLLSVIVEGGSKTLRSFIDKDLWDEARVFTGPDMFKTGLKAPELNAEIHHTTQIASDILKIYRRD